MNGEGEGDGTTLVHVDVLIAAATATDPNPDLPAWSWWCTGCCGCLYDALLLGGDAAVYHDPQQGGCGHTALLVPRRGTPGAAAWGCTCPSSACRVPSHVPQLPHARRRRA